MLSWVIGRSECMSRRDDAQQLAHGRAGLPAQYSRTCGIFPASAGMQVGIKYYHEITQRIPREEIAEVGHALSFPPCLCCASAHKCTPTYGTHFVAHNVRSTACGAQLACQTHCRPPALHCGPTARGCAPERSVAPCPQRPSASKLRVFWSMCFSTLKNAGLPLFCTSIGGEDRALRHL